MWGRAHEARGGSACGASYTYPSYGQPADDACARVGINVKEGSMVQAWTLVGRYFWKFSGAGESIRDSILSLPRVRNEGHWWHCEDSYWANSGQDRRTT